MNSLLKICIAASLMAPAFSLASGCEKDWHLGSAPEMRFGHYQKNEVQISASLTPTIQNVGGVSMKISDRLEPIGQIISEDVSTTYVDVSLGGDNFGVSEKVATKSMHLMLDGYNDGYTVCFRIEIEKIVDFEHRKIDGIDYPSAVTTRQYLDGSVNIHLGGEVELPIGDQYTVTLNAD